MCLADAPLPYLGFLGSLWPSYNHVSCASHLISFLLSVLSTNATHSYIVHRSDSTPPTTHQTEAGARATACTSTPLRCVTMRSVHNVKSQFTCRSRPNLPACLLRPLQALFIVPGGHPSRQMCVPCSLSCRVIQGITCYCACYCASHHRKDPGVAPVRQRTHLGQAGQAQGTCRLVVP